MTSTQLMALQVVLPLLAAPLCALLPRARLAWLLSSLVAFGALAISISLLGTVLSSGTISYEMGGWAAPWGIEYRLDAVNAFVLLIISLPFAVITPWSLPLAEREVGQTRLPGFYAALMLCYAGLTGMTMTGDAFNIFVFLEISSLATYTLIATARDRRALTASFQYLIMGTIGATLFLIGVGLLYMLTGTLNIQDLAARLPGVEETRTLFTAQAFILVGLALKLALFPLHLWLPNAYAYSPSVVTAFLAAASTKVAIYVMIRFIFTVFGGTFFDVDSVVPDLLAALAILGIFIASIGAIAQNNVKKLLAYSSVAQVGYIVLGLSLISVSGLNSALLHMFNHALMKAALFMAVGCLVYRAGAPTLSHLAGIGRKMPWTMAAFVIAGLSLIGVPTTAGFISKWVLLSALFEQGLWWIGAMVVISSLLAVVYIWKVVEAAYFREAPSDAPMKEAPLVLLVPTWLMVAANIYFGFETSINRGISAAAARVLMGAAS